MSARPGRTEGSRLAPLEDDLALEVLARSLVELEILPTAPDMKSLYTEQFLPDARGSP